MMNNTQNQEFDGNTSEANRLTGGQKIKEYGKQAYRPIVEVVHKYQDEITPFISALVKGLQGGVSALSQDNASTADKTVAGWFREAADGLEEARNKVESQDLNQLVSFVEDQARKRPSLMFSSSYITGLFFGRIGRHIGRKGFSQTTQPQTQTDYNLGDQSLPH